MFSLPNTAVADLTGTATTLVNDIWVIVAIFVGVQLGFYIIRSVINAVIEYKDEPDEPDLSEWDEMSDEQKELRGARWEQWRHGY
jgi:hypothetical protein